MIYRSDTKSVDCVLRCTAHTTTKTAYLINNKNAEISDRRTRQTEQFTSDASMMERIFKCQFSELIVEELQQSRYRLGRRRSILVRTVDMNAHSNAGKLVINAPLRLPHGRSGPGLGQQSGGRFGLVMRRRAAQNGWKTTERLPCLAAVSNFQSRSITSSHDVAMTLS